MWPASVGLTTPRWGNLQSREILAKSCSGMGQGSGGSLDGEQPLWRGPELPHPLPRAPNAELIYYTALPARGY